jgi:Mg-chelatase subunit ChlD
MSVALTSAFLKSPSTLTAEERPVRAVKIVPSAGSSARRSFHLVLALDVSGSMEGPRITAVRTTLNLLLEGLTDGDTLSLVSYQSTAEIVARAVTIGSSSRLSLQTIVENLRADGGTNLESAFVKIRELTADPTIPTVDAVFVLTDGIVNQGLTSSVGLTRLLTASVPSGTPVFTLGFGADVNSRMLRDIALRTRGSYTYADAAELIPATIADIISGLATEVGRGARLVLPAGWRCLEITAEAGATEFNVGALVSDKEQWIVLEGPSGPCDPVPVLTFVWRSADGVEHTETCVSYTDFDALIVAEQYCRCRVATVQTQVQELLEARQIDEARVALRALGDELDASVARERTFVITLRAQVDEMVEALATPVFMPGLARAGAGAIWGAGAPSLAPILSRMASNTSALGAQRGMMSHINSIEPPATPAGGAGARATRSGVTHMFCSPSQSEAVTTSRARYSQMTTLPTEPEDPSHSLPTPPPLMRTGRLTPVVSEVPAAAADGTPPPTGRPQL